MPERRELLKMLGFAALSLQVVPILGACAAPERAPADSLTIQSSRASKLGDWAGHTHLLYVPLSLLREPPARGVSLETTWTYFHNHTVALTHDQLGVVAQGGTVEVRDTNGTHSFVIREA